MYGYQVGLVGINTGVSAGFLSLLAHCHKMRCKIHDARQAAYYLLFWLFIIYPFSLYAANGAEIGLHQARLF